LPGLGESLSGIACAWPVIEEFASFEQVIRVHHLSKASVLGTQFSIHTH
jgi:hypothetical protein